MSKSKIQNTDWFIIEVNTFSFANKKSNKYISSYRLRVEGMLLKAEFEAQMSYLDPSIEAMLTAGEGNQSYCLGLY